MFTEGLSAQLRGILVENAFGLILGGDWIHHGATFEGASGAGRIPDCFFEHIGT